MYRARCGPPAPVAPGAASARPVPSPGCRHRPAPTSAWHWHPARRPASSAIRSPAFFACEIAAYRHPAVRRHRRSSQLARIPRASGPVGAHPTIAASPPSAAAGVSAQIGIVQLQARGRPGRTSDAVVGCRSGCRDRPSPRWTTAPPRRRDRRHRRARPAPASAPARRWNLVTAKRARSGHQGRAAGSGPVAMSQGIAPRRSCPRHCPIQW